jgi:hypothetical protein
MIDRRAFVQRGIAGAALALFGTGFGSAAAKANIMACRVGELHVAIFDRRFAAGRHFARRMEAQSVTTRAITGDVTSIWFHELHPLWRQRSVAIAGLTTYAPLFCLERLGWDHGLRVLQRDQLDAGAANEPDQLLYSWIIGPRRST